MKNKIFPILLLVCALALSSCGGESITADEVAAVLPDLVENSFVLNEIFFGEGFAPLADGELGDENGYYYADTEKYALHSISDIKQATEKVFTEHYAEVLYERVFERYTVADSTYPPKFIEEGGRLMQSMNTTVFALPVREYDYATMKIVESDSSRATVSVETVAEGIPYTVELIVVRTENADGTFTYRLDSPTY